MLKKQVLVLHSIVENAHLLGVLRNTGKVYVIGYRRLSIFRVAPNNLDKSTQVATSAVYCFVDNLSAVDA